jgi:hypothetical protein
MATQVVNLGEPLNNDSFVFRAFPVEGYRHRKKNKVRRKAFYRTQEHTDGLSVGTTPAHAVAGLVTNCGYCELPVGPVHELPHNLRVCPDMNEEGHALITNLPFFDGTDEERGLAEVIAGKLVRIATIVTCDFFPPRPPSDLPSTH